jgi:hypothetical protein
MDNSRMKKLTSIKFHKILSYTYSDEYPELARGLKAWLQILDLRATLEIQEYGRCSFELLNSIALCVGTLSHVFCGVDRALTKDEPISSHFRGPAGRELLRSFKEQGICTVPPYLLLALFDPRRIKQGNITCGLLEDGSRSSFLLTNYMYSLIRRSPNEPRSQFSYWCHMTAEIMTFCSPSGIPFIFLHYLAVSICEILVRFHNFKITLKGVKHSSRAKGNVPLVHHEITEMHHVSSIETDAEGNPVLTKLNVEPRIGGLQTGTYGALFIFDPSNFAKIIQCLRLNSMEGPRTSAVTFKESEEKIHKGSTFLDTILMKLVTRAFDTEKRSNKTLLVAFVYSLLGHMKNYAPTSTNLNLSGLKIKDNWGRQFLEDVWISVLYKSRMEYLPAFTQVEESTGGFKFTNAAYQQSGRLGIRSKDNISRCDEAFYRNYAHTTLGMDGNVSSPQMDRIRGCLEVSGAHLLDIHLSNYWYLLGRKLNDKEKLVMHIADRPDGRRMDGQNEEDSQEEGEEMLDVRCYIFNVVLQPSCDSLPTRTHRFDARNHTKKCTTNTQHLRVRRKGVR